jgi:hypothetical protein
MCNIIRRALANKTRKDARITFYKAMRVPILAYGSEIWTINTGENSKVQRLHF